MVASQGSILQNRAHRFVLCGTPGGETGFLNIYALNDSQERCVLWEQLIFLLPTTCRWVVAGDFNMVEMKSDKTNQCSKLIPFRERQLFTSLKTHLQLMEPPRTATSLTFSWDNRRWNGARILTRLDRLYLFRQNLPSRASLVTQYVIRGNGVHSDHCPIQVNLYLEDRLERRTK
jgi:endonuclease/exonuclease/phosphatase family metal-dependent hydrolase